MESIPAKRFCLINPTGSSWLCLLLSVGFLLPSGCNQGKQLHSDLIQRELRLQEDEIYRLEDYLEEYQQKVCRLRAENQQLLEQLGQADSSPSGSGASTPTPVADDEPSLLDLPDGSASPDGSSSADGSADSSSPDDDEPSTDVPMIDFGTPSDPPPVGGDTAPSIDVPVGDEPPPFVPDAPAPEAPPAPEAQSAPAFEPTLPEEVSVPTPEPLSLKVEAEALTPILTPIAETPLPKAPRPVVLRSWPGPKEPNGQSTLVVRVTAEQASNRSLAYAGGASLLLRKPESEGPHLARWDYTPEEVLAAAKASDTAEDGFELLLGLPADIPPEQPLELWARLVDEQGNKTHGVLSVLLPSPRSAAVATAVREQEPVQQVSWTTPAVSSETTPLPPAPAAAVSVSSEPVGSAWRSKAASNATESTIRIVTPRAEAAAR